MSNSIAFDSFFQEKTVDNNGVAVTDINAGLANLYKYLNDNTETLKEEQLFLVRNHEVGYPDLIAYNSILGAQDYWWWLLILNRLANPFEDFKENWVYAINSADQITELINGSNSTYESAENKRIGTIIELN